MALPKYFMNLELEDLTKKLLVSMKFEKACALAALRFCSGKAPYRALPGATRIFAALGRLSSMPRLSSPYLRFRDISGQTHTIFSATQIKNYSKLYQPNSPH
jgi:hypothetical protein